MPNVNSPLSESRFMHHLKNQFLIAMPQLEDPHFEQTVIWLMEHNQEGAFGLTLNRPSSLLFREIVADLGIDYHSTQAPPTVLWGGPVHPEVGFILHRDNGQQWANTRPLPGDIQLTTSRDIIEALAAGNGPDDAVLILGYCAWDNGQLEQEILDNTWLSVAAEPQFIFDVPLEQRWLQAARPLGVDIRLMTQPAGHA